MSDTHYKNFVLIEHGRLKYGNIDVISQHCKSTDYCARNGLLTVNLTEVGFDDSSVVITWVRQRCGRAPRYASGVSILRECTTYAVMVS
jgi:hypothetical protein